MEDNFQLRKILYMYFKNMKDHFQIEVNFIYNIIWSERNLQKITLKALKRRQK